MTDRVLYYFEEICKIPHPSHQEKAISDYLVAFAKEFGLECYQDDVFNVVIIKEASAGCEDKEPIMIQGHMDMVAEKEPGCTIDMEMMGLNLVYDGDFLKADGTTLGADDGVAIAYALAILELDSIRHPRIEFVCTVSEEVGMDGARAIDLSMCKAKKLLNLDSEDEGVFLAGCAGGSIVRADLPIERINVFGRIIGIEISGLTGGHSGQEIDKYRANATLLMNRILTRVLEKADIAIVSMRGGSKDNAIPRQAIADFIISDKNLDQVKELIAEEIKDIKSEYAITDPAMAIEVIDRGTDSRMALSAVEGRKLTGFINALPNGVITMSSDINGLVETSLNLGIAAVNAEEVILCYCVRSNVDSAHDALVRRMQSIIKGYGGTFEEEGKYPAWQYRRESAFRDSMVAVYKEMYQKEPVVETIHAGVECGLLCEKIKGLDAVSIGPDLFDIHTPSERMSISSMKRVFEYVVRVLEEC